MPVASAINFVLATLETLAPDTGATIFSESWNPAGGDPPFQKNYIGERKRLQLDFTTPGAETVDGTEVRFIPALFVQSSQTSGFGYSGNAQYRWLVDSTWTAGTEIASLLDSSLGSPQNNRQRNYECTFERIDAQNFTIRLEFYVTEDEEGWLVGNIYNHDRFLKSHTGSLTELTEAGTNVYTNIKRSIGIFVTSRSTVDGSFVKCEKFIQFNAGFYTKDFLGAPGHFNTASFTLEDGSGNIVTNLLFSADTLLRFRVTANIISPNRHWFYLIRTDKIDNSVLFLDNYEASVAEAINEASLQLGGAFYGPATAPVVISATNYESTITIDNASLVVSGRYRIIAVCYKDDNDRVTTFISPEYTVDGIIGWTGEGATPEFNFVDYHDEYPGGTLTVTVEERLRARLRLNYPAGQFSADILNRLGITCINDIRRYLTKIKVQILEHRTDEAGIAYVTYRDDIFADVEINRLAGTYPANSGLSFSGGLDNCEIAYDFRVRYESWVTNLLTIFDGTQQPTPQTTQFWPGRTLTVRFILELYYDDYGTPFTDRLIFDNYIEPKDYVDDAFFEIDSDGERVICQGPETCYEATLDLSGEENEYKLITTIEALNGNSVTVEENEVYLGDLPQRTSLKFSSQEEDFGETDSGVAHFCIDTSILAATNLKQWKVVAIAKFDADAARLVNNGEPRFTNDSETRIVNG